jgi:hypothetical protein
MVKGMEPCCIILSTASQLPLAPRDRRAHMACLDTPWSGHMWRVVSYVTSWPSHLWQPRLRFTTHMHGFPVGHLRKQYPCIVSQMADQDNHMNTHTHGSGSGDLEVPPLEVLPPEGWKYAQRGRMLWPRRPEWDTTAAGLPKRWCGTSRDIQHHSARPPGPQPLGAILQLLPLGLCKA